MAVLFGGAAWVGVRRDGWGAGGGGAKERDEEEGEPKGRNGAAGGIDAPASFSGTNLM